jgi:hypothetical protein
LPTVIVVEQVLRRASGPIRDLLLQPVYLNAAIQRHDDKNQKDNNRS